MFQPVCPIITTQEIHGFQVMIQEKGSFPSFKRVTEWFKKGAEVTFTYSGKLLKGRITGIKSFDHNYQAMISIEGNHRKFSIHEMDTFIAKYIHINPVEIEDKEGQLKKKFIEERQSPPSQERITFWLQHKLPIIFQYRNAGEGDEVNEIQGKITRMDSPYYPTFLFLDSMRTGIYIGDILYYKTSYYETSPYPFLIDKTIYPHIKTITLISGSKKFTVNHQKLLETVPYFNQNENEFHLDHLLTEQQLDMFILYLDEKLAIKPYNAFDFYFIAASLQMDKLKKIAKEKAEKYLIKHASRQEIDFLRSDQANPVLRELVSGIGQKIIDYWRFRTHTPFGNTINVYYWDTPKEVRDDQKVYDNLTLFSHLTGLYLDARRYSDRGLYHYHLSRGLLEVLRITEILGAQIEFLCLKEIFDSDLPLLISGLKDRKLKNLQFWSSERTREKGKGITKEGILKLVSFFQKMPELEGFGFKNHLFGDEGIRILTDHLKNNKKIKECGFFSIPFSTSTINYLCKNLKDTTVELLSLDKIGIGKEPTLNQETEWVQAIISNPNLKTLSLKENDFNDQSVDVIVEIIRNNHSLKSIDLRRNFYIGEEGRVKLVTALKENMTLEELFFSKNCTYEWINLKNYV